VSLKTPWKWFTRKDLMNRNLWIMVAVDAVLIFGCYYLAYLFRFEFDIPKENLAAFQQSWHFVVLIKISVFGIFHLYRGMWRYTSLVDLVNVIKAVFTSSLLVVLIVLMVHQFWGYPRSVFIVDGFLTFLTIGGVRMGVRLYFARGTGMQNFPVIRRVRPEGKKLLIIGAGDAGEKVLREIRDNPELKFEPVGFLDDHQGKQGKAIHGVPVLGPVEEIDLLPYQFDEILIAIPSAKGEEMRRIVAACDRTGKRYRTVPGIGELIGGKVSVKAIREVTLEDLLGREEVHLDQEEIARYLSKRRILVTGAGGSIGSELVRQVSRFQPQAMALLEVNEFNLFRVEMECHQRFGDVSTSGFLVDIRDREAVGRVFREFDPQVVFHAAAYKHVPIQELHPWEAVHNNVLGTKNLVEAALEVGLERFVLVSTDKAVRPTSVMGATKRVAEMLVECANGISGPCFMSVRFGNVIGSSGSAIPIFQEQIARGGPVTVTHPEATRYFMSISEAAQLILQAGAMGEGGEIFVLDMGKPVRIVDMTRDLIRLHGFEPDQDIPIQFIGLRPGEKLSEELITQGEGIVATAHEKILVLRGNACDLENLIAHIDELLAISHTYDPPAIKHKLQQIVPEYVPQL
jgi:FlaA1/EpsC-like NDP-sugar epimerase